ncbi:restriction endonuclease subunit S [Acinetobacter pittii]|uniref:restriction endonuclease subunit S n=1 Tax=Acinetobacter pittii TaxID=48296 RepID=UPI0021CDA874|nr:restriction endonuclease subunit S [Acinetobacter pittii]
MSFETIKDIVDFNPSRPLSKGKEFPFIDMASLPVNGRDINEVSNKVFNGGGAKFKNGDTLFARITPCLENGKTAKVENLPVGCIAHGSTEFIVLSAKSKDDEDFVYYLARLPDFRSYAISRMEGTSGRQRVSWQALAEFNLRLPEKGKRKKIGKILKSLDDKIHLNNQINQTLESIAQTIFKSWFIDFDPVRAKIAAKQEGKDAELAAMCAISGKSEAEVEQMAKEDFAELQATAALFPDELVESELGEVPNGWEVGKLQEVIDLNPRRTLKKDSLAPYLDMKNVRTQGHLVDEVILRNMTSGTKFINGDTLLARITPCLENGKTAYVDFLLDNEVGWGSTEFIVLRPKEHLPTALGYFIARQENFRTLAIQSMTGTSGRQRANADTLANQSWLIYPADLMIVFDKYAGKYLTHIKNNGLQNGILKNIRDALLPKLLSGELDATLLKK